MLWFGPRGAGIRRLKFKAAKTKRNGLSGTQARVAMEVVIAVLSGWLVHALRIMQRRRVPTHRGGGHGEIPQVV